MRIGTWNLDCRLPTVNHRKILHEGDCDIWFLTELNPKWLDSNGRVGDYRCHHSDGVMGRKQYWAAILSRQSVIPLNDPHPASAVVMMNGITYCSTILPWRGVKTVESPWEGANHSAKTEAAIKSLLTELPKNNLVWGGDWNHSLIGPEVAGSKGGREHLLKAIACLNLQVPTAVLKHRNDICNAIDHIGVPCNWKIAKCERIIALGLSDHDAYVVEI